ncbi:hypothetical protein RFI_29382 [Reticulomyxa filosa]|uniref:RGS domain-containing protein n=1 Tax=Reticulomyxa filosa TaxID=46433 RepID=X6M1I3_RETFI|nr:hypothetical protein RFI_29382 [Reticulomyxa filosa]|eukprot:ETO08008.1 hypothetical protein RFI_29382 [Reticulomyxa filosa]
MILSIRKRNFKHVKKKKRGWIVVSPETFYYGMVVIYAVLMLVIMGVTKKVTALEESLLIRRELLLEFRILATFFGVLGLLIIFGSPMGWDYCIFFVVEASALAMTAMGSVATWWLLDKSQLFNLPVLMERKLEKLGIKEEQKTENGKLIPSLRTVLNDRTAVNYFLEHLIHELSLENVFFLADVMRYKKSFLRQSQFCFFFLYFSHVPGFAIQMEDFGKIDASGRTYVEYASILGRTYVENVSASYVTAIHVETRDRILDYLETLNPQNENNIDQVQLTQLCNVFDPAAEEVWRLLNDSWKRYAKSPVL